MYVRARYLTVFFLLVALFSTISPIGHGAVTPSASVQHDSLTFTVNPDTSVGINWNTTTYSLALKNQSSAFPAGSPIHYSSSFTPQSNGLVETTSFTYNVPAQAYISDPLLSNVNSLNLTASETGMSSQGSLTFSATLPIEQVTYLFSTSPTQINANLTAQLAFSSTYANTPVANQSAFSNAWLRTFGNQSYMDTVVSQIQNSTLQILSVKNLNGTITTSSASGATVFVKFIAIPGGSAASFLAAFENLLNPLTKNPTALDNLIQSALNLVTGQTVSLTYSGTTKIVSFKSTTTFVSNLDAQIDMIKNQYLQQILNKTGPNPPQDTFLNSTSVTLSHSSMTSDIDLNSGTYSSTLSGTMINPKVNATSNSNFTIPGMFKTVGSSQPHGSGLNITLIGGSDSSNIVKVVVPTGPTQIQPTSTTSNSATWENVQNASELANVRFEVQPAPFSIIGFLTSTTGFILEGVIAAAIIAAIALYARKRRSRMSTTLSAPGPTPSPGFSPSPGPPTQTQG